MIETRRLREAARVARQGRSVFYHGPLCPRGCTVSWSNVDPGMTLQEAEDFLREEVIAVDDQQYADFF